MGFPPTLLDLQNDVLSRLNEPGNSPAGRLPDGVGGTIETTLALITRYLNDAAADFCRDCFPLADSGTLSAATGIIRLPYVVCASGNTLWTARRVVWNGVELDHASRSMLELDPSLEIAGTPTNWYEQGVDGVGIIPPPSTSQSATVYGLAIPKPLVNSALPITGATNATPIVVTAAGHGLTTGQTVSIAGVLGNTAANGTWVVTVISTSTISLTGSSGNGAYTSGGTLADVPVWLAPDLTKILAFEAAAMFARKNLQNTALGPRADVWEAEAMKRKQALLVRLWQSDPELMNAHYPRPLVAGK